MDQFLAILDWQRMLLGDYPPLYMVEIVVRTLIIYAYTLALLRWLGSRTIGQLSTVELLLVIALGSAVGDAMFYPDVPLVHALLVVTIVVVANKVMDLLIARFKGAEHAIDGIPEEAIRNGVIRKGFLKSTSMGPSELFQQLRERGVEHLGQVAHAYIEADGGVTVYRSKDSTIPGLPIVPPWELSKPEEMRTGQLFKGLLACLECGTVVRHGRQETVGRCTYCQGESWTVAQAGVRFAEVP